MPAKAPPSGPKIKKALQQIGLQIRRLRKELNVSATIVAESAGVSRMTLNRIEKGEVSVTMGAYLNVISVLGLELNLTENHQEIKNPQNLTIDTKILLSNYPQLKKLAWQLDTTKKLTPKDALNIYERNWRHIDVKKLSFKEREFIQNLLALFGKERLFV
ncbi:MAG TPA: helix-turn-helix domain-containing protein [Pseudobdellovibrionaceae bacterium]|nr:helix-turn-helix domain-containing protein [Pseudobdellovibrionaceae bacterium]